MKQENHVNTQSEIIASSINGDHLVEENVVDSDHTNIFPLEIDVKDFKFGRVKLCESNRYYPTHKGGLKIFTIFDLSMTSIQLFLIWSKQQPYAYGHKFQYETKQEKF